MKAIVSDVQTWSLFSEQKGYAFNGYAVSTEDGTVLIDPPDPGDLALKGDSYRLRDKDLRPAPSTAGD